jgi:hypothetical protein
MALSEDRFFANNLTVIQEGPDGPRRIAVERYGYESHQHLFDVDLGADGSIRYAIDCRTVEGPSHFHRAVIKHFGLEARLR